jgi:hypothetical protein
VSPDRFLEIYLADHLAAAAAGFALVRRAARNNTGTRTGDTLRRLTVEIDEDRHTLRRLVTDLGFTGSKPKEVVLRERAVEKEGTSRAGSLHEKEGRCRGGGTTVRDQRALGVADPWQGRRDPGAQPPTSAIRIRRGANYSRRSVPVTTATSFL